MSQLAQDILGYCAFFLLVLPLVALLIFFIIIIIMNETLRAEYRRSLNEHDSKVIADYLSIDYFAFKNFKRNPKIDINFDKKADE